MKIYIYGFFIVLAVSLSLGNNLKDKIIKKDIKMEYIKIEDVKLTKNGKDSVLSMKICNKDIEDYYIYERFIPKPNYNTIWTFMVFQEGKKIPYKGTRKKIKMKEFPDGYIAIEPNKCLPIIVKLNDFFDFNQDEEITLRYLIGLKSLSTAKKDININFTKTLLAE